MNNYLLQYNRRFLNSFGRGIVAGTLGFVLGFGFPGCADENNSRNGDNSSERGGGIGFEFPNNPPIFSGLENTTIKVGYMTNYFLYASDFEGDMLIYSVVPDTTALPEGAILEQEYNSSLEQSDFSPYTGRLIWAPNASQLGPHDITFKVEDLDENGNKKGGFDQKTVEMLVVN